LVKIRKNGINLCKFKMAAATMLDSDKKVFFYARDELLLGMHRSFGRSFGLAEYRPFTLRFGSAEAVAEAVTTKCFSTSGMSYYSKSRQSYQI